MAAKSWEADFRFPAIQTSMRLIRDGYLDDPFACPSSFCIPVVRRPAIGLTPGKIMLIFLALGFAGLIGGVWLGSIAEKNPQAGAAIMALAVTCSLSGIGAFFVPVKFDRAVVSWLIGERGRQLIERAGRTPILVAEVSDADRTRMKLSVDGDDHVLIYPDDTQRRILIEGTAARYQIRAEDVEQVLPFEFMNYVGVEVVCRIGDDARLHMAVARVSLLIETIHQVPILFFLRKYVPNRLYERFVEVLDHSPDVPS